MTVANLTISNLATIMSTVPEDLAQKTDELLNATIFAKTPNTAKNTSRI